MTQARKFRRCPRYRALSAPHAANSGGTALFCVLTVVGALYLFLQMFLYERIYSMKKELPKTYDPSDFEGRI